MFAFDNDKKPDKPLFGSKKKEKEKKKEKDPNAPTPIEDEFEEVSLRSNTYVYIDKN